MRILSAALRQSVSTTKALSAINEGSKSVVAIAVGMPIGNAIAVHAIGAGATAAHQLARSIAGVWQINRRVAREEAKGLEGEADMLHWHDWEVLRPHNVCHTYREAQYKK